MIVEGMVNYGERSGRSGFASCSRAKCSGNIGKLEIEMFKCVENELFTSSGDLHNDNNI